MTYKISWLVYAFILKIFCNFKVTGRENLPGKGPFIIVSNHTSWADPVIMAIACGLFKPVTYMAKKELFERPIFGRYLNALGATPIERSSGKAGPIKKALSALKKGKIVGLFPEGTRSEGGKFLKPEPGVGFIALKSRVPVMPFYIYGADKLLPRGANMLRFHKITVKIGKPVYLQGPSASGGKNRFYQEASEKVMEAIAALKNG